MYQTSQPMRHAEPRAGAGAGAGSVRRVSVQTCLSCCGTTTSPSEKRPIVNEIGKGGSRERSRSYLRRGHCGNERRTRRCVPTPFPRGMSTAEPRWDGEDQEEKRIVRRGPAESLALVRGHWWPQGAEFAPPLGRVIQRGHSLGRNTGIEPVEGALAGTEGRDRSGCKCRSSRGSLSGRHRHPA